MLVALLVGGCSGLVTTPAPPDAHAVLVLPVDNRTGSPLSAEGPLLLDVLGRASSRPPVTATEILTRELRRALEERGITTVPPPTATEPAVASVADAARVVAATAPDTLALYTRLRVWETIARSHLLYVDVALDATLVASDGRIVWSAHLPATPIDAGGASSVSLGYPEVARRVAEMVTGDLGTGANRR